MAKLADILSQLAQPVPSNMLAEKSLQGNKITYIPWYNLADLLDERAPGWEYKILNVNTHPHTFTNKKKKEVTGLMIVCTASITIHGEDGSLTRQSMGYETVEDAHIGDSATNAEANGLRRTCGKLGLGRDLWRKGKKPQRNNNSARQNTQRSNAQPQQRQEPQLTPEQMVSMVRTMLDNSYLKGGKALQEAIKKANTKLSKFPRENRPAVMEMIKGYTERLAEFEVAG